MAFCKGFRWAERGLDRVSVTGLLFHERISCQSIQPFINLCIFVDLATCPACAYSLLLAGGPRKLVAASKQLAANFHILVKKPIRMNPTVDRGGSAEIEFFYLPRNTLNICIIHMID